jgi:hypothetical protein
MKKILTSIYKQRTKKYITEKKERGKFFIIPAHGGG